MSVTVQGLKESVEWLGTLESRIPAAALRAVGSDEAIKLMVEQGKRIVQEVIYDVYDPVEYRRTMATLNSVDAAKTETGSVLFMQLDFNTETVAGSERGDNVYAMFMIPGYVESSFIRKPGVPLPRPFYEMWNQYFEEQMPLRVIGELDLELQK